MSALAAAASVAGLAMVAAAGVAAGFLRQDAVAVEPPADPLEDRRVSLLRSLADLEEARGSGALEEAEYRRLLAENEERMARVHRALDRRSEVAAARSATAPTAVGPALTMLSGDGLGPEWLVPPEGRSPSRMPPWLVAVLLGATVMAVVIAGLLGDSTQVATGSGSVASSEDPLAFFERRVRDHPGDLAARLDLAHRYLDAGRADEALAEYAVSLELDPDDAEALAHVGLILYGSGRPEEALASVDRALETDPRYPEALFIRGVILFRGLQEPAEAIEAFEAYLEAAPFGSERATVADLIDEAREALEGSPP